MPHDEQREKLHSIVERIQVGDTEEGVEALQEMMGMARAEERVEARQAVREELANLRIRADTDGALQKFGRKYPKVASDPLLVEAGMHALRDEIAKDLRTAGMSDEELTPIRGDLGRLASLHGKARLMGREGVRQADKLLDDVGGVMSRSFNIPAASRSKKEFLLEERTRRGFSNDHLEERNSAPEPDAGRDRTRRIIAEARKARGFPSLD